MNFKKLLLSLLITNIAFSPFVVSVKTKAGITEFCSDQLETVKNGFYSIPSYLSSAALAGEELGVQGLEKLSFTVNPASIYQFFRKHHEMTAVLAFLGVCGAWYSSKKISAWNAYQTQLRHNILDSIQNNFVQFSQICTDINNNNKRRMNPYAVLPTNAITLADTQNIVTLPFLKKDQKLYNLLNDFYAECANIIAEANSNTKPDSSSATYKKAFDISNQIKNRLVSLL